VPCDEEILSMATKNVVCKNVSVEADVKAVATSLRKSMKAAGHSVPHSVVLHAVAAALGVRDWHQLKAALGTSPALPAVPLEREQPEVFGPVVTAKFWTDDYVVEASFEAQAYMSQASDAALRGIFEVGFVGDSWTDVAAEYAAEVLKNPDILEGFEYLNARNKGRRRDTLGFECSIDPETFLLWMDANKKPLLARMLCDYEGVTLVPAQGSAVNAGQPGWTWEWYEEPDSETSFLTEESARLDAYDKLSLLNRALTDF
jgi:hypothetical protein